MSTIITMAQHEIYITRLLKYINSRNLDKAKQCVQGTEQELVYLETIRLQVAGPGKIALDLLQEVITILSNRPINETKLRSKCINLQKGYQDHLQWYLKKHYSEGGFKKQEGPGKKTGGGEDYEEQGPQQENMSGSKGSRGPTEAAVLSGTKHDLKRTTLQQTNARPPGAEHTTRASVGDMQNSHSGKEREQNAQKALSGAQLKPQITNSNVERDRVPISRQLGDYKQEQKRLSKGDVKQKMPNAEHAKVKPPKAQQNNGRSSDHQELNRERTAMIKDHPTPKPNNPDIADLSDANRPTKIAEKFSELYDNEWTEAFDDLLNKRNLEEPEVIAALLHIVEKSYSFCMDEAKLQLETMNAATLNIIQFGTSKGSEQVHEATELNLSLLKEFRKSIAFEAVPSLQQRFFEDNLPVIYKEKLRGVPKPSKEDSLAKYANRAVELSWWMCVQIPPVYMFPAEHAKFDPSLYRAYTKTGKNVAFFVWPALKLYEKGGGILAKGVVQFQ